MTSVTVTDLKANLARYLRMVRRGGEVLVTERGVPVARLIGLQGASAQDDGRIARLAELGLLRRGTGDLGWLLDEPPIPVESARLGEALAEDREDRM